ncbi:MAG: creatininase family protein [Thioalkalivibrio sp.]|nr:MAG: creatininase family protein [Thioalkalivibrio sp.]
MNTDGFVRWQDLTSPEIRALVPRDPVVVLPLAAIEQHGPHLPLSTDLDIGLGLLDAAAEHLPEGLSAVVLPPVAIATSMEHTSFPGTLSLEPETALAQIRQLGAAVAGAGFRRLLFCNSHGGNTQLMDLAGLRLRRDHGLLVVKCSYFRLGLPDDVDLPAGELRHGYHGGALETAMMLHLAPERVRMEHRAHRVSIGARLEEEMRFLGPEGPASFSWMTQDLHRDGVVGNALLADAALGSRLVRHYGTAIATVIRETAAFPLDLLRPDTQ